MDQMERPHGEQQQTANGGSRHEAANRRIPDDDAVRRRAYELYQARGAAQGAELDDWLAAEREVRIHREQEPAASSDASSGASSYDASDALWAAPPAGAAQLGRDAAQDDRRGDAERSRDSLADLAASSAEDESVDASTSRPADPLADAAGDAPGARDDATEGMASAAPPRPRRRPGRGR